MKEKIDVFSPVTIFAFVSAFVGDIAFILALGVLIPIIGLVFLAYYLAFHYIAGGLATAILWHKTQGWLAKLMLILALLLPLPLLCIGVVLAILLSNKLIAFIAEQAIIIALTPETGGVAAVVGEGAVVAARTAEAALVAERAARAARAAETAAGAARGAQAVERGAGEVEKAAKKVEDVKEKIRKAKKIKDRLQKFLPGDEDEGEQAEDEIGPEALGEEPMPMDELERKLVGEEPVK